MVTMSPESMLSTGTLAGIGSPGTGRFSPITMPVTVDVPSAVSTLSWTLDWAWDVTEPTFIAVGIVLMGAGVLSLGGVSLESAHLGEGLLLAWLLVSLAVAVIGFAFLTPSAQALISRRTHADRQGEVLGVNQSASALARILGPAVGSALFFVDESHVAPYALGAALMAVVFALTLRLRQD